MSSVDAYFSVHYRRAGVNLTNLFVTKEEQIIVENFFNAFYGSIIWHYSDKIFCLD